MKRTRRQQGLQFVYRFVNFGLERKSAPSGKLFWHSQNPLGIISLETQEIYTLGSRRFLSFLACA
jgi:hypothetical protein